MVRDEEHLQEPHEYPHAVEEEEPAEETQQEAGAQDATDPGGDDDAFVQEALADSSGG